MRKLLTALAALTMVAAPVQAQSFESRNACEASYQALLRGYFEGSLILVRVQDPYSDEYLSHTNNVIAPAANSVFDNCSKPLEVLSYANQSAEFKGLDEEFRRLGVY